MGTRNMTYVVVDGERKVGQYGQWDGYPEGQGETVCKFIAEMDIDEFRSSVRECFQISDESWREKWSAIGVDIEKSEWVDVGLSRQFGSLHPHLHRDCGAEILCEIAGGARELQISEESEWCEWTYTLNLDDETLIVESRYYGTSSFSFDEIRNGGIDVVVEAFEAARSE
jgi:hypothetical protein